MNIVAIRNKAVEVVGAALGAPFKELPYQLDVLLNDVRALESGYAVVWGRGSEDTKRCDQSVGIDQDLTVQLVKQTYPRSGDAKTIEGVDALYSAVGVIINRFIKDKLDLPGVIQEVRLQSLGKPEVLDGGLGLVSIGLEFQIRYLN